MAKGKTQLRLFFLFRVCLLYTLLKFSHGSVPCVCSYKSSVAKVLSAPSLIASPVANFPAMDHFGNAYCFQIIQGHTGRHFVKVRINDHKTGFVHLTNDIKKTTCQTAADKTTTGQPSTTIRVSVNHQPKQTVSRTMQTSMVTHIPPSSTPTPTHHCLCNTQHLELFIRECSNLTSKIIGILHKTDFRDDTSPNHCAALAIGINSPAQWETVAIGSQVGYVQVDQGIAIRRCPGPSIQTNSGMISQTCTAPTQSKPPTVQPSQSTTHPCVCNKNHMQIFMMDCPENKADVIGILYKADIMPDYSAAHCAPIASMVHTAHGWESVLVGNKVGFIQLDQGVIRQKCPGPAPSFSSGMIAKKCSPYFPPTSTQTATRSTTTTSPHLPSSTQSGSSLHRSSTAKPRSSSSPPLAPSQTPPSSVPCICDQTYDIIPVMECPNFDSNLLDNLYKMPLTSNQSHCAPLALNIKPIDHWTAVVVNGKVGFIMKSDKDNITICKGIKVFGNEKPAAACNVQTVTPTTTKTTKTRTTPTKGQTIPLITNALWTLFNLVNTGSTASSGPSRTKSTIKAPPPLTTTMKTPPPITTKTTIRTPPPLTTIKTLPPLTTSSIKTPPPLTTTTIKTPPPITTKTTIRTPPPLTTTTIKTLPPLTTTTIKTLPPPTTTIKTPPPLTTTTIGTPSTSTKLRSTRQLTTTTPHTSRVQSTSTSQHKTTTKFTTQSTITTTTSSKLQSVTKPSASTTLRASTRVLSTSTTQPITVKSTVHQNIKKTCDRVGLLHSFIKRENILHPNAGRCDDTLRHDSEAAVMKHCGAPVTTAWTSSETVTDHCDKSRLYSPVGAFASNQYFFNAGILLDCFDGGRTVQVFMQDCSTGLHIQNITMSDGADLLHFINW